MKKNLSLEKIKEERRKSRIEKISSHIKKTLAQIFLTHDFNGHDGKRILIFVSHVTLAGDGKSAIVFVETLNKNIATNDDLTFQIIEKNFAKIKKEFAKRIDLRYTPKLKFEILNSEKIVN